MRIKEIEIQLNKVLTKDIISKIDLIDFAKLDPEFPIPSNILLKSHNVKITYDQLDDVKDGKVVELVGKIDGTYDKTQSDNNLTKQNNFIKLNINSLMIQIVNEKLEIINLNYSISDSRF
jgi:hypothetical protein